MENDSPLAGHALLAVFFLVALVSIIFASILRPVGRRRNA